MGGGEGVGEDVGEGWVAVRGVLCVCVCASCHSVEWWRAPVLSVLI